MLGNFTFHNPCAVHFGPEALDELAGELASYGDRVLLVYGGGSVKRTGLYDEVISILAAAGKTVAEVAGVMSNPTADKLREGCKVARDNDVDLILAVGGGSTIDYAKGVSVGAWCDGDPWEHYYLHMEDPQNRIIPVGDVLTMSGTGSEMNAGSVITDHAAKLKIGHVFGSDVIPRFAIVNPEVTFTVPDYQMRAGIFDAFNHVQEQYFSGDDDNVSDYLSEGLMRSLVRNGRAAVADPADYEARSNVTWACTLALNTLIACGKATDWEVHMLGQAIGAVTDATHGMTLSAVAMPYYRLVMPYGLPKFRRFATEVFDVDANGKTDEQVASEGLDALEAWMGEIGVVMHSRELGLSEDLIDDTVKATFVLDGGYHELSPDEVRQILVASL
ncbi:MAG: iron-containing alcohol dehydrogenase [Atopobiaceae bacterium]|jgi:alcohol dehydrogenase YqhD (iron-dependent ADH family)|nr:iron-containing alcohol dehydrogenase [Atopobiaceae bacterium]MCH4179912.1 iron-containing alcohol dehydrogenase [Atopobiaceae bacterium]MCH4213663.1 iron-containing alcohol dehydrogenase [Atopobiaceae bacterium]MCH4275980.1 iron-containing alcohol dehydrogenase [Atopobiaceae bacterium]MCI1225737.1 iron-containing alcohol dehydrogenase [Atopobiaceae bacterium]